MRIIYAFFALIRSWYIFSSLYNHYNFIIFRNVMGNSHGLKSNIVKKQAAARKLAKWKKKSAQVYIGNENPQTRKNQSYKDRRHYLENKQNFPKKKLKTKNPESLIEQGIIDERGFFVKGKKKNFLTKSMVDSKGMDFYGMPR